jgi:hypothetical protein
MPRQHWAMGHAANRTGSVYRARYYDRMRSRFIRWIDPTLNRGV